MDIAEIYLWINANVPEVHAASLFKIQNAGVSEIVPPTPHTTRFDTLEDSNDDNFQVCGSICL